MVRHPYVDENGVKKGAWSEEEDDKLRNYILRYGHWNWRLLPKYAGLTRCGKSCRLRWVNYLKPGLRLKNITQKEGNLIAKLHDELGNKWSAIAEKLPGRTDNEVKNYWHAHIKKHKGKMKATPQVIMEEEEESEVQIFESSSISDPVNYADLDSAAAGDEENGGFWKEPFVMDTSLNQDYYLPLLIQEGLLFDQLLNLSDYDFNLL